MTMRSFIRENPASILPRRPGTYGTKNCESHDPCTHQRYQILCACYFRVGMLVSDVWIISIPQPPL